MPTIVKSRSNLLICHERGRSFAQCDLGQWVECAKSVDSKQKHMLPTKSLHRLSNKIWNKMKILKHENNQQNCTMYYFLYTRYDCEWCMKYFLFAWRWCGVDGGDDVVGDEETQSEWPIKNYILFTKKWLDFVLLRAHGKTLPTLLPFHLLDRCIYTLSLFHFFSSITWNFIIIFLKHFLLL